MGAQAPPCMPYNLKRQVSGRLVGRGTIGPPGPEGLIGDLRPFHRGVAFAGLDDGFSNCAVLPLNDAVRSRVVSRNLDMSNAEATRRPYNMLEI
jgi:hypothetical protein